MTFPLDFASDNAAGVSPKIAHALARIAEGYAPAYAVDSHSEQAVHMLRDVFERDLAAYLVATGTGANALALGAICPPWGAVICHSESHIMEAEVGAPEFYTHGAKLVGLDGVGCKITPEAVVETLDRMPRGVVHYVQPAVISISQGNEAGLVYTLPEIAALAEIAHARGMKLHMDGARFANALVSLGCSAADMTWRAGVDVLSFGATKNGCWACEAIIFFDKSAAETFPFQRKRGGHLLSKGRFLGVQMEAYLADGHWLDLARHANACAASVAAGLTALPGVRLAWPCQINEIFPIMPAHIDNAMKAVARYYDWTARSIAESNRPAPHERLARLIASFQTTREDVDRLLAAAGAVNQTRAAE